MTRLEQLLAAAVVGALVLPRGGTERLPVLCLVRRATGRRCPGCGMTTSWSLLAHGRVLAAFRAHPFGPLAFALALRTLASRPPR